MRLNNLADQMNPGEPCSESVLYCSTIGPQVAIVCRRHACFLGRTIASFGKLEKTRS